MADATLKFPVFEIGPRLVKVELPSCYGCPALRLASEANHTAAYCSAKPSDLDRRGELITPYWRIDRHPPSWCPAD